MGTVVYSASPLQAFSGGLIVILCFFGLSFSGILWAIFMRKERPVSRIVTGCASIFLLVVGIATAFAMYLQWQDGDRSVTVQVDKKRVVESNCNDSRNTCTSYVLETSDGKKEIDFTVAENAFELVEVNACYQFTYYPSRSLLSRYTGEENEYAEYYETASSVTRIVTAACP